MNKNTQSLVLSDVFFRYVKEFEKDALGRYPGTSAYKIAVMENAYRCLASGHSFEFLKQAMLKSEKNDSDYYNIEEYMAKKLGDFKVLKEIPITQGNLIQPGKFYLHPQLQETSKKPSFILDSKTMEIIEKPGEPFYLEMKERFSVEDVLAYYYIRHGREAVPGRSHTTQMNNILTDFGVDSTLFLIDASAQDASDEGGGAKVPAFLPEYIDEAKILRGNRKTLLKEGGLDRVHPRERYLEGIEPD